MSLASCFLQAPPDQVDPRVLADAKTWSKPPRVSEVARTLDLARKFPISRIARQMLIALEQEARDAELVSGD